MSRLQQIKFFWQIFSKFGFSLGWAKCLNHLDQKRFGKRYYEILSKTLMKTVHSKLSFGDLNSIQVSVIRPDSPIWVMWWQGEMDSMPALVKSCIASIRANAGGHPVHIITESNYNDYIHIPPVIMNKLQAKQITITAFSDIVRFGLLSNYGGLWLDSTVFVNSAISPIIDGKEFFTIRRDDSYKPALSVWSNSYTSFCIGGCPALEIFDYMYRALIQYWSTYTVLVDYFLIDSMMKTMMNLYPESAEIITKAPVYTGDVYELEHSMNTCAPLEKFLGSLYKLNRKGMHREILENGSKTLYRKLLDIGDRS